MLLNVLVSMMSAPAARYASCTPRMTSGPREHEQIVVAAQVARVAREARAPEVGLGEGVALDHRAHRTVEHENAAVGRVI